MLYSDYELTKDKPQLSLRPSYVTVLVSSMEKKFLEISRVECFEKQLS